MTSSPRQLLVTGASGFLGSRIVDLALHAGWHVRVFDRSLRTHNKRVETFVGDIADTTLMRKACEGVTAVVHAAGLAHVFGRSAKDPKIFNAVNEVGTGNVVYAALKSGVSHIALVSSVSVYGPHNDAVSDESSPCRPLNPYAISKWKGELRAIECIAKNGGALTILRMATIYGEGDQGNVARLIAALDRGHFIWPGSGLNRKSLIYKDDAANACLRSLEAPVSGVRTFNVSSPAVTMREIVTAICEELGRPAPRLRIPQSLIQAASAFAHKMGNNGQLYQQFQKFIRDDVYSGYKFESTYNFHPAVSLDEGIRREVNFLRS
ncbi:MAG: NAD-dependent epimerase/dehydratase family protein [Terracidiphilus sp.]